MTEQLPLSSAELQRAQQLLTAKNYEEALGIVRSYWLANPQNTEAVRLLSRIMKGLGRADLSGNLYKVSECDQALGDDLPNLCETGFNLIDARELQLAVMVLSHCAMFMQTDPTVAYELGFALMSLNKFSEAIPYFLKSEDDFETRLNLCVCYMLTRNLEKSAEYVEKIGASGSSEEETKEVAHRRMVLKRLERFKNKQNLTPRDWAFILYGTVLLSEPRLEELSSTRGHTETATGLLRDTAGKSGANEPDYKAVAWTLLVLEKILNELGYEFDIIEFYSPLSRPVAEALAHKLDLPAKSFRGESSTDRSLMIMSWAPNIIGPHKSFMRNGRKRILFAYGISPTQPLPLTPDVVGEFCYDLHMPWAESSEEETIHRTVPGKVDLPDSSQAKATDQILAAIAQLESVTEIIQTVQELADYYKPKVEQLVLGNPEHFAERPQYTAEIVY